MTTILVALAILITTLLSDYFIKMASYQGGGIQSLTFATGLLLSALPAFGWYFLMRDNSLSTVAVVYSASSTVILSAMGVVFFKESLGPREALAVLMAIASVVIVIDTNH